LNPETPFPATGFEVSDRFLLLGVNRDHRLMSGQSFSHNVAKLRVPIGIGAA
jgi:hypothetical protein